MESGGLGAPGTTAGTGSSKIGQIFRYENNKPEIAADVYIAPGAILVGKVYVDQGASIWFNAVLRADYEPIHVGARSNIQDLAVVHIDRGFPAVIGDDVTVGHAAVIHGAVVGEQSLIGMNSTLLTGSRVGNGCLVAAGAVVREHAQFGNRALIAGVPARQVGTVDETLFEKMSLNAESYVNLSAEYVLSLHNQVD